jgi:hypothetical protein
MSRIEEKKQKIILDLTAQLDWMELKSKEVSELAKWIHDCLICEDTSPLYISGDYESIGEKLAALLEWALNNSLPKPKEENYLRRNLGKSVKVVFDSWARVRDPNMKVFEELLFLIGRLNIAETNKDLIWHAWNSNFQKYNPNVHRLLLQSIIDQKPQSNVLYNVCERDIENPLFSSLCFEALINRGKVKPEYLLKVASLVSSQPELIQLDLLIFRLFNRLGSILFLSYIESCHLNGSDQGKLTLFKSIVKLPKLDVWAEDNFGNSEELTENEFVIANEDSSKFIKYKLPNIDGDVYHEVYGRYLLNSYENDVLEDLDNSFALACKE